MATRIDIEASPQSVAYRSVVNRDNEVTRFARSTARSIVRFLRMNGRRDAAKSDKVLNSLCEIHGVCKERRPHVMQIVRETIDKDLEGKKD